MSITRWPEQLLRLTVAATLLTLAACSSRETGPVSSQQRGVDVFHSIDLRGTADVIVEVGAATAVTVSADASTLEATATTVRNGMLVIENKSAWKWFDAGSRVEVRIATPTLNALSVNGAGNVTISNVQGTALALALQGAGNLTAAGQTQALNARINGAGNMDLSQLIARDATVTVNGTGNLGVHATGSLQATLNGVGSITYSGSPQQLDTHISGVGTIAAR